MAPPQSVPFKKQLGQSEQGLFPPPEAKIALKLRQASFRSRFSLQTLAPRSGSSQEDALALTLQSL